VTANSESDSPAWTTSLAILAWLACEGYQGNIDRAVEWTLATHRPRGSRSSRLNEGV